MTSPADYPPPFRASEFVTAVSDDIDSRIDVGVLVVRIGSGLRDLGGRLEVSLARRVAVDVGVHGVDTVQARYDTG